MDLILQHFTIKHKTCQNKKNRLYFPISVNIFLKKGNIEWVNFLEKDCLDLRHCKSNQKALVICRRSSFENHKLEIISSFDNTHNICCLHQFAFVNMQLSFNWNQNWFWIPNSESSSSLPWWWLLTEKSKTMHTLELSAQCRIY